MYKCEYELKYLITKKDFEEISRTLSIFPSEKTVQTNYYYDTYDYDLSNQNITMRVREKDGKIYGTIKRHFDNHMSTEEYFSVNSFPPVLLFEGREVYQAGMLLTERTSFHITEKVSIMLDQNTYLGIIDHELEIECEKEFLPQVKSFVSLLFPEIQFDEKDEPPSKSERFFKEFKKYTY